MKELQDFADTFTQLAEVLTADHEYQPFASIIPPEEDPLERFERRLLVLENRLSDVHRQTDRQELRLDAQLSRISELEIRAMTSNGRNK